MLWQKTLGKLTEPFWLSHRELQRLPDDDLMEHLRLAHHDALTVLFDRYQRVFCVALKVLRDVGEAEDLVQGVFVNLHLTAARFDPALSSTKVWIFQMAYVFYALADFRDFEPIERLAETVKMRLS